MVKILLVVLVGFLALGHNVRAGEVLYGYENPSENKYKNWDFESALSNNDWKVSDASVTKVSGGHTGGSSVKIEKRTSPDGGVRQVIGGLTKGHNYYVSFFIKVLNNPPSEYASINVMCKAGSVSILVAKLPYQVAENMWKQIGGDFEHPGSSTVDCFVRIKPNSVNYQLDSASLIELKKRPNWKAYLDEKIKKLRTSTLKVKGKLPAGCSPSSTTVKVELKWHDFGFGTAIKARNFIGTSQTEKNYRNFVLEHFNWAVFENAMKWQGMEQQKGVVRYDHVDKAMKILLDNHKKVRCHNMLWEMEERNPDWLRSQKKDALKNYALNRISYMMKHYKADCVEWDVCNEFLHRHFYEEKSGYKDLLINEFKKAYSGDSKAKLFLNDFEIMKKGRLTSAISDLAEYLNKNNAHCGGIGIQSHLRVIPIAEEVMEKRLQIAGRTGLPITITEFTVHSNNVYTRATALDMAFRVYFADPHVHAIMLWGFTDKFSNFANDFFLTNGDNMKPNAAGQNLLNLIEKEWSTKKDIKPSGNSFDVTINQAFQGTYKVTTICGGQVKTEKEFHLGKGGATFNV